MATFGPIVEDVYRQIREARLASLQAIAQIRVTRFAIHDDWNALRRSPEIISHIPHSDSTITGLLGLPVVGDA